MLISKTLRVLFFICLLGLFLRFYQLGQIPNSLSGDEAAFGYNAYAILQTGRDEYGLKYPLLFQSFNDHKNPVFVYLLVPFVKLFGLNEYAIRLPSVIFGVLLIPLFYLLTQKLTSNKKLSLLTAFLAAISPWLIQYSRIALEVNIAFFFSLLAVWLFLEAEKKNYLYLFSGLSAGLGFWTYYASKLWLLLFFPFLIAREIIIKKKINKFLALSFLLFVLSILPYLKLHLSGQILARQYGISVFSDKEAPIQEAKILNEELKQGDGFSRFIHNRRWLFFNQLTDGYLRILSPVWLFSQNGGSQIPGTRLNYLWQLPLIFFGLMSLLRLKKWFWLMIFWLSVGFLPGGIAFLPSFDRRILINSYPLIVLSALGLIELKMKLKNQSGKKIYLIIGSMIILGSFLIYQHYYFGHGKSAVIETWGNGMKQLVNAVEKERVKFDQVIVSIELDQPLTYFLFYTQYPPEKYLSEGGTVGGDFREERNHFSNYEFKKIDPQNLELKNLYAWKADETYPCLASFKTIYQSDGRPLAHLGVFNPTIEGCAKK